MQQPARGRIGRCIPLSTLTTSGSKTRMSATRMTDRLRHFSSVPAVHPMPFCAFLYPRYQSVHLLPMTTRRQSLISPTMSLRATRARSFSLSLSPRVENTSAATSPSTSTSAPSATLSPPAPDYLDEAELHIYDKLTAELQPTKLEVQDISGGCGSMYGIQVESERFRGLSLVKQQKLVNSILKEEIGGWHGVQLRTGVPSA